MSFVALGGIISFGILDGVAAGLLGGAVGGAAMGAAGAGITGGDVGKGALMGLATGALGGGVGGFLAPEAVSAAEIANTGATAETAAQGLATSAGGLPSTGSIAGDLANLGYTPATAAAGDIGAGSGFNYGLAAANAPVGGTGGFGATLGQLNNPSTLGVTANQLANPSAVGANVMGAGTNVPTGVAGAVPSTTLPEVPSYLAQPIQKTPTSFLDNPAGWVKENPVPAAMGALTLGTTAYGLMNPSPYGMPSSSSTQQEPATPYNYDPANYRPTYPTPNVYVPRYAEGGIADLAGTPPNMKDGPADVDFMGAGAYPMSQQNRSFYAAPTQMPTSAQQAMASYEPKTNPLTGEPMAHMAKGGIAQLAVGGKLLKGRGDGMSDSIKANIAGKQEARLADGEFVVPADVVSHLGNGSTDAGAKHLYAMMDKVRKARTGNKKQGKQINPAQYMPA